MALPRRLAPIIAVAPILALAHGCREPTQITVDASTDVPCTELRDTAIYVTAPGATESATPVTVTGACDAGHIGSLVIVPSEGRTDEVSIKVVGGLSRSATQCTPPAYEGCIVARRALRFVPHEALTVPVLLSGSCRDVPCDSGSTCVAGVCQAATIPDPGKCASPGGCGDTVLFPGTSTFPREAGVDTGTDVAAFPDADAAALTDADASTKPDADASTKPDADASTKPDADASMPDADAGKDAPVDSPGDSPADAPMDSPVDAPPDVAPDVAPDVPPDVAPDAPPGCGAVDAPCITTLKDDFGDGKPGPAWNVLVNDCFIEETGNLARFAPPANKQSYCWYETAVPYDLHGDMIVWVPEVTQTTEGVQTFAYFRNGTVDTWILWEIGKLTGHADKAEVPIDNTGYSPSSEQVWRFRAIGNDLHFYTSASAKGPWKERGVLTDPAGYNAVTVFLGAGTWLSIPAPGRASFGCFNTGCP